MKTLASLVISVVFLVWFAGSVIGMIYVSRHAGMQWLIPVLLGQFFVVFGTAGSIAMMRSDKKGLWLDALAILVGGVLIAVPLVYHYGSEQTKEAVMKHIPTIAGAGIMLMGLGFSAATYISAKRSEEKYRIAVEGVCVEHKTHLGSGGKVLRCPVYEITLDGETHRLEKDVYSNTGVPNIGESRTLYIDDTDLESYAEPLADRKHRIILYCIALPSAAAGLAAMLLTL